MYYGLSNNIKQNKIKINLNQNNKSKNSSKKIMLTKKNNN